MRRKSCRLWHGAMAVTNGGRSGRPRRGSIIIHALSSAPERHSALSTRRSALSAQHLRCCFSWGGCPADERRWRSSHVRTECSHWAHVTGQHEIHQHAAVRMGSHFLLPPPNEGVSDWATAGQHQRAARGPALSHLRQIGPTLATRGPGCGNYDRSMAGRRTSMAIAFGRVSPATGA